ncbi:integrin-linked protein kinase 1-like isoform X2 [Physcomitrium patens]|uniref:integrin-linked protein kinase 1-like isoform X2 n=1 Tax=Physcomitrium patens TaxID=3218 RepID=UPI003CCE4DD3
MKLAHTFIWRQRFFDKSNLTIAWMFFSLGLILHEVLEGLQNRTDATPQGIARKRAYEDVRQEFRTNAYPRGMKELIQACRHGYASKRPAVSEIMRQLEAMEQPRCRNSVQQKWQQKKCGCGCVPW